MIRLAIAAAAESERQAVMRLNIAPIFGLVFLLATGCDRPLTFDAQGVAHGTGEKVHNYKDGAPKLREAYVDGELVRSRWWFTPDGALICGDHEADP